MNDNLIVFLIYVLFAVAVLVFVDVLHSMLIILTGMFNIIAYKRGEK